MAIEIQPYVPQRRSRTRQWLESPLFGPVLKELGYYDQMEARAILDERRINSPEYQKQVEAWQNASLAQEKQSGDLAVLGLSDHAGPLFKNDIRNAYRRASRKLHPDVGGTHDGFIALQEAYRRVLKRTPAAPKA